MKATGPLVFAFALAGPLAAQEASTTKPAKTSSRLKQEIQGGLPKYSPPPPKVLDQPNNLESDPEIFALPKVTVKEKRPPTHDPDVWLTDRAIQQKAMAAYKQSMTDLEWALNSWFIPPFSPPASARARSAYESGKALAEAKRMHELFSRVAARDAAAGAELEKERVKMEQAEYWQMRPAGHGRKK